MATKKVTMADDQPIEEVVTESPEDLIDAVLNSPEPEEEEAPETEDPEEEEEEDTEVSIDDLPDDSELWPGGPIVAQIKAWKDHFGDGSVYVTSITYDHHIVWRTITRAEYKDHMRNMENLANSGKVGQADIGMFNEEAIAEMCILFPPYDRKTAGTELAGVPAIISQEVMEASGFVALEVRQL